MRLLRKQQDDDLQATINRMSVRQEFSEEGCLFDAWLSVTWIAEDYIEVARLCQSVVY